MHIPRFWAKGEYEGFSSFSWSDRSVEDARSKAIDIAKRQLENFKHGLLTRNSSPGQYGYGSGPLREQVIEEIDSNRGEPRAVITRNSMGCKVLSCSDIVFVDIDVEPMSLKETAGGLFQRLLGKKKDFHPDQPRIDALKRVEQCVERSGASARAYYTFGGLRVLFTHDELMPKDPQVQRWFDELGADPLYVKLCRVQESFRARLTPKRWRCDFYAHPPRWPFENAAEEANYAEWLRDYEAAAAEFATCSLAAQFGRGKVTSRVAKIIEIHDAATRVGTEMPLA